MKAILSVEYGDEHNAKRREFIFELVGENDDRIASYARHQLLQKIMSNEALRALIDELKLEIC